jgi:NADH-quinone oxidoreductase subunit N
VSGLDLRPLLPALVVALSGLAVLLVQAFSRRETKAPAAVSLLGLLAALGAVGHLAVGGRSVMGGVVEAGAFSLFLQAVILSIGFLVVLASPPYLKAMGAGRGEYYALVLFAIVGMLGLVSCRELISLFVALEMMSISLYALAGYRRDSFEGQESAVKYFLTGAFSSAFLLYGMALLYGVSGSTLLSRVAREISLASGGEITLAVAGAGLLLVGIGFKVASVPFHMWAPDVYEGAPTTVTAFMSAGVKVAAFGLFLRLFDQGLPGLAPEWQPAVAALAVVTMVVGNLGALAQSNLKRMLAYSSVAHAGYLMTALVAVPRVAVEAVLFYLVAYAAVNLGGFFVLGALARERTEPLAITDMNGLASRRPALAAAFTVFLVSLTGVPVSAGFVGKFYLFRAAVAADYTSLALLGVLMSVVSAYYYLRVVVAMYMREPAGPDRWAQVPIGTGVALAVSVAVVLLFGVYPAPLLALARLAAAAL